MAEPPPRKARTRGNRDGKPYKRKSDGIWVAVGYFPNGKRKPCYGKTSTEAAKKRTQFYAELEAQQPITVGNTITVEAYLHEWTERTLTQREKAGRLAEGTADSYRDNVRLHIIPHLGKIRIVELSPAHIRAWLLELAEKPSGRQRRVLRPGENELPPPAVLSKRTQNYAHAILRKALADAVSDEVVKRNVCLLVDPPIVDQEPTPVPTKEQATALLAAASADRLWAYWLVVLALGLRRGEGLGLRWSLTDLHAKTTRLQKQVVRRRGAVVERTLKTRASKATMVLPDIAVAALREHRAEQDARRLEAKAWADPDLVFTTRVGSLLEPRDVNRAWADVCARAGAGYFKLHALRHAAATYLFAEGLDPKIVQSTLRHTRLATTMDVYTATLQQSLTGAASTMDRVLAELIGQVSPREVHHVDQFVAAIRAGDMPAVMEILGQMINDLGPEGVKNLLSAQTE